MDKIIRIVFLAIIVLIMNTSIVFSDSINKYYTIDSYDICLDKEYDIKINNDGTKTYILYPLNNAQTSAEKNIYLEQIDVDIRSTYPINDNQYGDFYEDVEKMKLKIYDKAKTLGFGDLQNKMKDYAYYPYTVCDYNKFNIDELKKINKELNSIYEELKETDVGSPFGFALDSVKANIISSEKAINNYSDSSHNKYKELGLYIENNKKNRRIFTLGKNIVNLMLSKEDDRKGYPSQSIMEIEDIKDNEKLLYYDANLIYNRQVLIPKEIIDSININDKLFIYTCDDSEINNVEPLKLIYLRKTSDGYGFSELHKESNGQYKVIYDVFKTEKEALYDYENNNIDTVWTTEYNDKDIVPYFYHIYNSNNQYMIEKVTNHYNDVYAFQIYKTLYKTIIPVKILKNARIMGTYWFSNLDSYFSDTFNYKLAQSNYIRDLENVFLDEENHNTEVLLKDIFNKKIINFTYREWQKSQFYLPLTIEKYLSLNNKRDIEEYGIKSINDIKNLNGFRYVDGIAYDEKGYVTAIYKGRSGIYSDIEYYNE